MALTKATNSMLSGAVVNVFDFMTPLMIADVEARTATVDTTAAIQAAINSLGSFGGVVRLPRGRYLTTAKITLHTGVSLIGDGQFGGNAVYDQGTTTILGRHNGTAVLSLVGAVSCTVSDLALMSDGPANPWPQTGLLLGRNTAASAGYHKVMRVAVYGNFTVANVYSIASEDNYWEDLNCWNYALGGAKNVFYTSISNSNPAMTEPLVTSSNLDNVFVRFWFTNNEPGADASCIYLDNAEGMGSFSFFGGYCTAAGGSYVTINNGAIDALSALGPFTFVGFNGERLAGGDPLYGFNLLGSSVALRGLFISGCRLDFLAGTNHYQIKKAPTLTLVAPNIVMQPPEAFPYALTDVFRDKVLGGILSIGREYAWTNVTFAAGFANTLNAPYAPASYCIDANGFVRLRGQIIRTTGGPTLMFTLPPTVLPAYDMFFSTGVGTGVGTILVSSSTGNVTLHAGTVTDAIDLTPVQFNFL